MSETERSARAQLSSDYEKIMADDYRVRWSPDNAGNREIHRERDRVLVGLTRVLPAKPLRVLDLGCGNLSILPPSIQVEVTIGVDLLMKRLIDLRACDPTPTVNGDGAHLPFREGTFDVVVMSTMMTSVLDAEIRRSVAAEVERALRPGGALVWYDMRLPNPRNHATRAIGRSELRNLFPHLHGEVRSLTVIPILARRLGRLAPAGYVALSRLPFMRSHLAGCLIKAR